MSQSSLVTRQWWANLSNYTQGRSDTIHGIAIHHAASTSLDSVGTVFSQYGRGGSAHYGVKGKQVHQYVREEDTAWAVGDWAGNSCTVSIEVVNSTGAPNWLVDEETFETTCKLVADIAKRNGLGKIKFDPNGTYPTLSAHRDWSATYCPGDYLYSRMNEIAEKANAINYPPKPEPTPKAEIEWEKLPETKIYIANARPTNLYDFNHTHAENCKVINSYNTGTQIEIAAKATNKTIKKTYLVSQYSWEKKITNGFLESDMVEKKPEPQPEPQPEPTPDPDEKEREETVSILQKIIDFINRIIKLITKK